METYLANYKIERSSSEKLKHKYDDEEYLHRTGDECKFSSEHDKSALEYAKYSRKYIANNNFTSEDSVQLVGLWRLVNVEIE